ncbi:ThrRS/AlaRS common domain-containing protein [Teratosphaeria destructans]|uniref:ThrRS/AlaRS common domain-containing protein n=1 Tax=Teratosphaeria destructans TaxID=418781 RepID=A0A9W7W632_9PEZI|nr:ThrRS/AlaRS common domain-containing protein [Teratosphaeria destructans]
MSVSSRTYLAFQHNAKLHTLSATVQSVLPASQLPEANKAAFKQLNEDDHVVVTDQTIFHPQGGGQPSDTGTMKTHSSTFTVTAVRMDAMSAGQVLHLGTFHPGHPPFTASETVEQAIDVEKRRLYSRLHTAGHVLGAATRKLLGPTVPGFDELKASHFPDMAACEFAGSIAGTHRDAIQAQVDDFIDADLPVEIDFWSEQDFRDRGLERLIVGNDHVAPGEKFRVVRIVGADTYPCGGTHVESTRGCGRTTVKKISRSKGTSRVSYAVEEG